MALRFLCEWAQARVDGPASTRALTGILPHKRLQPRHLYYQYQLAALALKNAEGELKVALNAQECKLLKVCPHVCAVCLAMAVAASTVLRLRERVHMCRRTCS